MSKTSSPGLIRLSTLDAIRKTIQHDIAELRKAVANANHTITIANANLMRLDRSVCLLTGRLVEDVPERCHFPDA